MLVRCLYASRATQSPMSKLTDSILKTSRDHNPAQGITGFLCVNGEIFIQVLEGDDAVARYREVMGATNPANAAPGTIRKEFAESIEANSVHGSDSPENAEKEIKLSFKAAEIVG